VFMIKSRHRPNLGYKENSTWDHSYFEEHVDKSVHRKAKRVSGGCVGSEGV